MSAAPGMASPQSASDGGRVVRIVVLVVVGLVVLCGLLGTCLFGLTLVAPLFLATGTPTPPF